MAKIKKAVTMSDIAGRLDVSVVTVSKALSGQKGVSKELRDRIIELAQEMGYKTPAGSEPSGESKSYHIGVLISARYLEDYNTSFYWRMYQELTEQAIQKHSYTFFECISETMEKEKILPGLLAEDKADGLVVIGKPGYDYDVFLKEQVEVPMVFLDFYGTKLGIDSVISDGYYGAYVLTNYLIDRGHRDIAYVGTLFATESITDRYLGYVKALLEHGILPREDYVIPDRDVSSGMRDGYGEFILPERMPSAFVCNCDFVAKLLIRTLRDKGCRVPEDISVVGYDNDRNPMPSDVGITTYAVDCKEMTRTVIRILLKRLAGDNSRRVSHIVEGYLVEKESVQDLHPPEDKSL
ncbi:MAG: LacI family DNA-binding transcriptional regulator [Roseburia sp.]|nr:LacI family DNA-binding transcriptional regulator [Roseburia sp.]